MTEGGWHDADWVQRQLARAEAETLNEPAPIRVGVAWDPNHLHAPVHVIDGDGASLCESVSSQLLVPIAHHVWAQIEPHRRCVACTFLLG